MAKAKVGGADNELRGGRAAMGDARSVGVAGWSVGERLTTSDPNAITDHEGVHVRRD